MKQENVEIRCVGDKPTSKEVVGALENVVFDVAGDMKKVADRLYVLAVYHRICSYLGFPAMVKTEDNTSWHMEIEVENDTGNRLPVIISRGELSDNRTWSKKLREAGMRLEDTVLLREVAQLLEIVRPEEHKILATKMGWHGNVYLLPDGDSVKTFGDTNGINYVLKTKKKNDRFGVSGTLKEWQVNVADLCEGNDKLVFALSAAFAAPLLKLTNGENTIFHFVGDSTTGKTVGLEVNGSVFGGSVFKRTWRTTDNAMESTGEAHNDAPLCMDEVGEIKPYQLEPIPYMYGNGEGKDRASTSGEAGNDTKKFNGICLSSGEHSFKEFIGKGGLEANAGQLNRWLDIPANSFSGWGVFQDVKGSVGKDKKEQGHEFAQLIKRNIEKYYGSASHAYLEWIIEQNSPSFRKAIEDRMTAFEQDVVPVGSDGQIYRTAHRFALVAASGELAIEAGVLPYQKGACYSATKAVFESWLLMRGTHGTLELAAGIDSYWKNLSKHGEGRFQNLHEVDGRVVQNRIGFYEDIATKKKGKDVRKIYVPTNMIDELITVGDVKTVLAKLRDSGIIVEHDKNKLTKRKTLPGLGSKVPCYTFTISASGDQIPQNVKNSGVMEEKGNVLYLDKK